MSRFNTELAIAVSAARQAAEAVLAIYETASVYTKTDGSYVTDADYASDAIIRRALTAAFPDDAILTEEGADDLRRLDNRRCWIVDPIDGTAAFVARTGDFNVYIALIEVGRPVLALSLQPTTNLLLTAIEGEGAWITRGNETRTRHHLNANSNALRLGTRGWLGAPDNLPWLSMVAVQIGPDATVLDSVEGLGARSFIDPGVEIDSIVGYAAPGKQLDGYEWDIAPIDLIVREAGGASTDLYGEPLRFNQPDPRLGGLLISNSRANHSRILDAIHTLREPG